MSKLFPIVLKKWNFPNTLEYATKLGSLGIHSIGMDINAPLLFNDVDIIQRNGIIATIASNIENR
jgi:hypothetical protein